MGQAFLLACQDIVWVAMLMLILLYIFAILAQGFFDTRELQVSTRLPGGGRTHLCTV